MKDIDLCSSLSSIVCLDACFMQKNNKQNYWDHPREHPKSVFVPEEEMETWQNFVKTVCPPCSSKIQRTQASTDEEDCFEGTMKVPKSVLDGCEDSFMAADGTHEKASTQFFSSTALMGLMCCHDQVLWLANMITAGEQQYYALTLIGKLFEHLPSDWLVGILYDIACQLECSCIKWGFLEEYFPRISFAISVFHVFGHGWPCHCIYHPRKCQGFGLSDGEGCERLWHSLSKLIPYLCVCGVS